MADLMERYESKYGPAESGYLYTLGGDPAAIVAEVERAQAAPVADDLAFLAALMPTTPEEDAHNAIMREIQRLYFLPISRAFARCRPPEHLTPTRTATWDRPGPLRHLKTR